jgi:hypothetical protein
MGENGMRNVVIGVVMGVTGRSVSQVEKVLVDTFGSKQAAEWRVAFDGSIDPLDGIGAVSVTSPLLAQEFCKEVLELAAALSAAGLLSNKHLYNCAVDISIGSGVVGHYGEISAPQLFTKQLFEGTLCRATLRSYMAACFRMGEIMKNGGKMV